MELKGISSMETKPDASEAQISVQRDYLPIIGIEPYDEEQQLFRGKILNAHLSNLDNASSRDYVYFERNYNPETNDLDKIFRELKFDDKLVGMEFTLVPMNKVRIFWTPPSVIHVPKGPATNKLRI